MRFTPIFIALFLLSTPLAAQMTLRVDDLPDHYNPLRDTFYVAGNFNNWNPGDPAYRLQEQADGSYTVQISGTAGANLEYKYTRGDWGRVETKADNTFLPNRSLTVSQGAVQNDQVARWEDFPGPNTPTGQVLIFDSNAPLPQFGTTRRIWIYLPPTYDQGMQRYPVLYMLDGQNLFDVATTAFGTEWSVDESLENIANQGGQEAIVVGIDNGGVSRIDEYTPWANAQYGGGNGEKTLDYVVTTLKPAIDQAFRTVPQRSHTAIAGSSLGGWMALYMAVERPDVFSKAGVFSPSFWYSDSCYQHVSQTGHSQAMRIYMVGGDQEGGDMVTNMYRMEDTLLAHGFSAGEINAVNHADGQHSEWYWAREFPAAFNWLFAGLPTQVEPATAQGLDFIPLDSGQFRVKGTLSFPAQLEVFDLQGKMVFDQVLQRDDEVLSPGLPGGIYVVRVESAQGFQQSKIYLK